MTVDNPTTGAVSHQAMGWHDINWQKAHREVRRLQVRIVNLRLEPYEGKLSCTVLRGGDAW
jgi:RNA-directed DNA polymerase